MGDALDAREGNRGSDDTVALRRLEFLAEAANLLSSSLDYQLTLRRLAAIAVPTLADWCIVYMRTDGSIQRLAMANRDPRGDEISETVRGGFELDPDAPGGVPAVLRTGRSEFHPEADAALLASDVRDPQGLAEVLAPLGIVSWICVPLTARGRTFGAISLISTSLDRTYGQDDLELAESLALRAALAVDNARLYDEAKRVQAELRESNRRAELLAEAGRLFASSLNHAVVLEGLTDLVVREIADLCIIDVVEPDGSLHRLAVSGRDEALADIASEIRPFPPDLTGDHPAAATLRDGRARILSMTDDVVAAMAINDRHRDLIRRSGVRSVMAVPLIGRRRTFGVMQIASRGPDRFGPVDLALAEDLSRSAALAVDNARLYEERSHIARVLQESLLPERLPEIPGLELAARFSPAGEHTDVGGDFYDAFPLGDEYALVVGDVCGKGVEAARMTALARYTLRAVAMRTDGPAETLRMLNEALLPQLADTHFCTVVMAQVASTAGGANVRIALGGHPAPYIVTSDGDVRPVAGTGTLLGALEHAPVTEEALIIEPGDALVFYTDGVTEARDASGAVFGEAGLANVLAGAAGRPAEEIASRLEEHLAGFRDGASRDDVAILVMRATV